MFLVGLTDQIKPQDPEVCVQTGGPEPNHFPSSCAASVRVQVQLTGRTAVTALGAPARWRSEI